jgi:hypothetical protein
MDWPVAGLAPNTVAQDESPGQRGGDSHGVPGLPAGSPKVREMHAASPKRSVDEQHDKPRALLPQRRGLVTVVWIDYTVTR